MLENELEISNDDRLQYFGVTGLSDRGLIEVIAGPYLKRNREKVIMDTVRTLDRNAAVSISTFKEIPGMPDELAEALMAALELGRRRSGRKARQIRTPEDIYNEVRHFASRPQENLLVIALNGAHEVIYVESVTVGLVNMTVVHPREVFSNAIMNRASAIVVSHNHPSGQLEESEEDRAITMRLVKAGKLLGIKVLDHVIISKNGWMSFREKGIMPD